VGTLTLTATSILKPINLDLFKKLMGRVEKVDRGGYSAVFIQALHALFFWTGLRKTEILGRKPIKYLVDHKECKGKGCEACGSTLTKIKYDSRLKEHYVWDSVRLAGKQGLQILYKLVEAYRKGQETQQVIEREKLEFQRWKAIAKAAGWAFDRLLLEEMEDDEET